MNRMSNISVENDLKLYWVASTSILWWTHWSPMGIEFAVGVDVVLTLLDFVPLESSTKVWCHHLGTWSWLTHYLFGVGSRCYEVFFQVTYKVFELFCGGSSGVACSSVQSLHCEICHNFLYVLHWLSSILSFATWSSIQPIGVSDFILCATFISHCSFW